jgi:hypothetical protein
MLEAIGIRVERLVIMHLKTQTNHMNELDLDYFWDQKMDGCSHNQMNQKSC